MFVPTVHHVLHCDLRCFELDAPPGVVRKADPDAQRECSLRPVSTTPVVGTWTEATDMAGCPRGTSTAATKLHLGSVEEPWPAALE
mmetsp:Transcript_15987/g.28551  ORF Transcript_15987/g.28551 Transcript_15987/m.28551 type:complete len:86 (+) Transcript_15987:64-321(+)